MLIITVTKTRIPKRARRGPSYLGCLNQNNENSIGDADSALPANAAKIANKEVNIHLSK